MKDDGVHAGYQREHISSPCMFSYQVIRKSYGERSVDSPFAKQGTLKIVEDT